MKTLILALLSLPFLSSIGSASATYTFTLQTVRGPIGFTYVAPEPLAGPSVFVSPWVMANCDTTGAPGWFCSAAYLRQTTVNGLPIVQVSLDIVDLAGYGNGFADDELTDSFPGASLQSPGVYGGFLSPATFTITLVPDSSPAATAYSQEAKAQTVEP